MSNLVCEREYKIRTYEVDKNCNLRIVTLFNIFQDIADGHAQELGVGLNFCLKNGLAWVGSNYHIKIHRMPKINERIIIKSWPSEEKKFGAVRDFAVFDEKGEQIISGSSLWILINYERRRPVLLRDNLPEYSIYPVRALDTDFQKIQLPEEFSNNSSFAIRYDDIDLNNHVNNAIYPIWATESVGKEFHLQHSISELQIEFKKEALYGETIDVLSCVDNNQTSSHLIKSQNDGRELSKILIKWKKL